jgi:hypothetical protein
MIAESSDPAPRPLMEIRLLTRLSSRSSRPGDEVRALVLQPVRSSEGIVIPPGSMAIGSVKQASRVGLGFVRETARIELEFKQLQLPDGRTFPLETRLTGVDNARERVDRSGAIRGVRATASFSHRVSYRVATMALANPAGMGPLFALQTGFFRFPDPEIAYAPGTEMTLRIEGALPPFEAPRPAAALPDQDRARLEQLVAALPKWSFSGRHCKPADLINLMFVGSEDAIERAFIAAGWTGAVPHSSGSRLGVLRSIFERRTFAEAPMRTLTVDDVVADMNWQKSLNTMTKRHHLRIWKRTEQWEGQSVWISSATHDVAANFTFRSGFIHEIDPNVDRERRKVVSDLQSMGCVEHVDHVARSGPLRSVASGERRDLQTDGALAVVFLNGCENAALLAQAPLASDALGRFGRLVRRLNLSARNHVLRDNLPWRLGETAWVTYRVLRSWGVHHRLARSLKREVTAVAAAP